jgi:tetratricopeptide (TPR) repeat protein
MHTWFSNALHELAHIEANPEEKERLLKTALAHSEESVAISERIEPLVSWNLGLMRGAKISVRLELADLTKDPNAKKSMLDKMILESEDALELCIKDAASYKTETPTLMFGIIAYWEVYNGNLLSRLYELTKDKEYLKRAIGAYQRGIETYQKTNQTSRLAESYWKIAKTYDELGDHMRAGDNFVHASKSYRSATERIPQLKDFYQNHALYMQAWNEIENARYHHERQEYDLAKEHFEKAAELHKSLKQWSYLESNYAAWAQVEKAEELSRKEESEEAIKTFERASKGFGETKKSLQSQLNIIQDIDEKQMVTSMVEASDLRREYCDARTAIEEARILDKKGSHFASAEKYGSAADTFQRISETLTSDQEQREFKLIIILSRAWQKMTLAESESSPKLYAEASQLFEEAKNLSQNDKTKMLMMGHSRFCKALEAGTEFADTRDSRMHDNATKYLESAASYYVKAGFQKASDYAEATGLLLDAYMHMDNAKEEKDPEEKGKLYAIAETVLQTSAGSFMRAEHPEKREQVLGLLDKVKKERELALSLVELLHAPTVVSSTTSFTSPVPTREEAVGSERFEHADIQANLIVRQKELKIGENLSIELELVNAGKGSALLTKVTEIVPKGFEVAEKPETCRVEDSYINLKGKRLDPLKTEEVKLVLKTTLQGTFSLKPTVLYLDENGKYKSHETEPVTITVKELGIKGWLKGER